jgi:hypothetical protein
MKPLPRFQKHDPDKVKHFVSQVFSRIERPEDTFVFDVVEYEDGHCRVFFSPGYFGRDLPSKSQWNSLKKKMKRHNKRVFVFKEHGKITRTNTDSTVDDSDCYYIDFGFFAK